MRGGGAADTAHASDCLAAPNSPAPQGSHWYYLLDWATQRKCWYLRAPGQPAQQMAAIMAPATPLHSVPTSRSILAANSAPISVSPGDAGPSSPHVTMLAVKPKIAPAITATTDKFVQRGAEGSTGPAMTEATAPQS